MRGGFPRPQRRCGFEFEFGMAVGVGGENLPETLERMIDSCAAVFVDIQALIRAFDDAGGEVRLVRLKESGFFHLLPRIAFVKASGEKAAATLDLEEVRKLCCVDLENAYTNFQWLLALARITGSNADEARGAYKKCGRVGHLSSDDESSDSNSRRRKKRGRSKKKERGERRERER